MPRGEDDLMKIIAVAFLMIIGLGCQDDQLVAITDGKVYSQLNVRYDKNSNKTAATAAFWKESQSGQRLIFNGNAKILFEDVAMDYRAGDYTYIKELDNFHSPAVFKITDVNNKVFTNTATLNTIDFPLSQKLDTIDSSKPLTIAWAGIPLEKLEIVTLRIGTVAAAQDTTGKTSVSLLSSHFTQLGSIKNTVVTITLERSKSPGLTNDLGGGGMMTSQYVATTKSVFLK
jgi:hypothetical protein